MNSSAKSFVTFGGYDSSFYKGYMHAHPISGSFHWSLKVNKLTYGSSSFYLKSNKALTDTGTTFIYLPPDDFENLMDYIIKDLPDYVTPAKYYFGTIFYNCNTTTIFKSLKFQIDNIIYELTSDMYMRVFPG